MLKLHGCTDILLISETHLTPADEDVVVGIPGYLLLRNDSGNTRTHGVCAYVSERLTIADVDASPPNVISFQLSSLDVHVYAVYRPPSNSREQDALLISYLLDTCIDKEIILMGDFNLPSINWSLDDQPKVASSSDSKFLDAFDALGLTQWIEETTFPRSGNILDLILTSEADRISEVEVRPPPPGCDHCSIHCQYSFDKEVYSATNSTDSYVWFKGRYNLMNAILSEIDWDTELMHLSAQDAFTRLLEILEPLIAEYVPASIESRSKDKVPWKTNPPTSMKRKRAVAWQEYKHARTLHGNKSPITRSLLQSFLQANKQLRSFAFHSQVEYEKTLLLKIKENPKLLHSYLRCKKKLRPSVGPLRLGHNSTTDNPLEMAECFSNAFASIFTSEVPTDPAPHQQCSGRLEDVDFDPADVRNALLALDVNSAMGPDGLHPHLLKACAGNLAHPLYRIYKRSLEEGSLPPLWKLSLVVPIFKKGSHTDPLNYRPICLPSVPAKCLERIISRALSEFFIEHNILTDHQFGFRPNMSTEDQLLITYDYISRGLDKGRAIDLILFDFAKAFDVVCHTILLDKLRSIGIGGKLLNWLHEFLCGRTMQVVVKHTHSSSREVKSGVPQGSVLGPILFLVYINYIAAHLKCQYKIFADDLKIYAYVDDTDNDSSTSTLQSDINHLYKTAKSWGLNLNIKKCATLRFQRRSHTLDRPNYTLNGQQLPNVCTQMDLGLLIDDQLKFHEHSRTVVRKAGGIAQNILKGTVCREPEFMTHIFKIHIRPLLEYASTVWNTGYIQDIRRLESVQRLWTRQIRGLEKKEYGDRLKATNLYSAKGRFLRADLIKCWKIFNGKCPIEPTDFWEISSETRTRGHQYKIKIRRSQIEARARFFTERVAHDWNALPAWAVSSSTLKDFKFALESCLQGRLFDYLP